MHEVGTPGSANRPSATNIVFISLILLGICTFKRVFTEFCSHELIRIRCADAVIASRRFAPTLGLDVGASSRSSALRSRRAIAVPDAHADVQTDLT